MILFQNIRHCGLAFSSSSSSSSSIRMFCDLWFVFYVPMRCMHMYCSFSLLIVYVECLWPFVTDHGYWLNFVHIWELLCTTEHIIIALRDSLGCKDCTANTNLQILLTYLLTYLLIHLYAISAFSGNSKLVFISLLCFYLHMPIGMLGIYHLLYVIPTCW